MAIKAAQAEKGFTAEDAKKPQKPLMTGKTAEFHSRAITVDLFAGFGHNAVMSVADKVIDGVKTGAIKRFFVVGGCDGSEGERRSAALLLHFLGSRNLLPLRLHSYFSDVAKETPKDSMILTMGCGKYRFNRMDLGDIGGIPRVLDLGQVC